MGLFIGFQLNNRLIRRPEAEKNKGWVNPPRPHVNKGIREGAHTHTHTKATTLAEGAYQIKRALILQWCSDLIEPTNP